MTLLLTTGGTIMLTYTLVLLLMTPQTGMVNLPLMSGLTQQECEGVREVLALNKSYPTDIIIVGSYCSKAR